MQENTENIDMPGVLQRLSNHLDFLAGRVFEVEQELGALLTRANSSEEISITKIQSLDFTRQSLEDCSLLLQVLRTHSKSGLEAGSNFEMSFKKLKLKSTESILNPNTQSSESDRSGQVDLF